MNNADVFAARLARIEAGGPNTKGTIFVGQDEQHHFGKKAVGRQGTASAAISTSLNPFSLIAALGLGLVAMALGTFAHFKLTAGQLPLENADLEMAVLGGIGLALSLAMAQLVRLTSKEHKALQVAGVFAMICGFHNLAHWTPGPMSALFSPAWVQQYQDEAPPNSARFRGLYFTLDDMGSASAPGETTVETAALPECPAAMAATKVTVLKTDNAKTSAKSAHKTLAAAAPDGTACKMP